MFLFFLVCGKSRFTCKNGDCIDTKQRCDYVTNCPDGDDELGCSMILTVYYFKV